MYVLGKNMTNYTERNPLSHFPNRALHVAFPKESRELAEKKSFIPHLYLPTYYYIRVSQIIVLTSQTDKYLWDQTFSDSLGQKNYRNAKKFWFF